MTELTNKREVSTDNASPSVAVGSSAPAHETIGAPTGNGPDNQGDGGTIAATILVEHVGTEQADGVGNVMANTTGRVQEGEIYASTTEREDSSTHASDLKAEVADFTGFPVLGADTSRLGQSILSSASLAASTQTENKLCSNDLIASMSLKRETTSGSLDGETSSQWHGTVKELAGRGLTLGAILDLYSKLWRTMPHFDPSRSTTRDVVFCSIIPLTADDGGGTRQSPRRSRNSMRFSKVLSERLSKLIGNIAEDDVKSEAQMPSAFATQVNRGKALKPDIMVTHHWDNLFCHTVAAIIADAMRKPFYREISEQLHTPHGTALLNKQLEEAGLLQETYWFCAMSVNQHRSICHRAGRRLDTVLGIPHQVCNCGLPKESSGDLSEMNKFDDMMAYIRKLKPHLRQVVVVDREFGIFGRAWCIAEVVEAFNSDMAQHLKIYDDASVTEHRSKLNSFDVSKCEASRVEDKEFILAKIPDIRVFNTRVRKMLLDESVGLFESWAASVANTVTFISHTASSWDQLSQEYVARLSFRAPASSFWRGVLSVSIIPPLGLVGLFVLLPLQEPTDGWKANASFWFLFLPSFAFGSALFFPCFCNSFVPGLHRTWYVLSREIAWSFSFACFYTAGIACVAIGFDAFPVPLAGHVGAGTACGLLPLVYFTCPLECRREAHFKWHFSVVFAGLVALYSIFGFVYPLLNAWYSSAQTGVQALVVVIFLSTRLLFELIGVLMAKAIGADLLPCLVFYSVTAYEWQMEIMLTRASHWVIFCELVMLNILENLYFLKALTTKHVSTGMRLSQTSDRVLVALLARELAEALASCQFCLTNLCIYLFRPEKSELTRGVSHAQFTQGAVYVGITAVIEAFSLAVTCTLLSGSGWQPLQTLRGFIALHGDFVVKAICLASFWFIGLEFEYLGNDLTFKFAWLKSAE